MFYLNPSTNKRYTLGTPFTYNGVQYTAAGATHDKFIELGFTQVVVGARPNDRFYIVSGPDSTGQYTTTERDLASLQDSFCREEKRNMHARLARTDWHVIRRLEEPMLYSAEPKITNYRSALRQASNTYEAAIKATTTVAELITVVETGYTLPDDTEVSEYEY